MNFKQKLQDAISKNNSLLCIGLDTDINKIPNFLLKATDPVFEFNKEIIKATFDLISCYKANIAYYSADGIQGLSSLTKTIEYLKKEYPWIPFILDAKRADIGSTSEKYAHEVFDAINADATTVNPYLGTDSIEPFLRYKDKGIIILCRTSNPGAKEFQDLRINGEPLYIIVAKKIIEWNKQNQNCMMVAGATWPEELREIRKISSDMFLLIPGVGTQGGDLQKTVEYGMTKEKSGLIIHSARAIIYSSKDVNFAASAREKAKEIKDLINKYRNHE